MRFEHLVEVNDLSRRDVRVLSHEDLWRGLVVRAERPDLFVPGLGDVAILSRSARGLVRALRFGEVLVTDEVHFAPPDEVRFEIAPQGEIPRSSLRMRIEEPSRHALFVRFVYDDDGTRDAQLDEVRKAAYEAADIDTIATIRLMTESGDLAVLVAESAGPQPPD
jgi:hypothetical protein